MTPKVFLLSLLVLGLLGLWGCGEKPPTTDPLRPLQVSLADCTQEALRHFGLTDMGRITSLHVQMIEGYVLSCVEGRETDPKRKERFRRWAMSPEGPRGYVHLREPCIPLMRAGAPIERYWRCLGVRLDLLA